MKALLAGAFLALALAGCSGSSGPVELQANAAGEYEIHMPSGQNVFLPANAHVPAGAKVVWVHDGGAHHDVVVTRQDAQGSIVATSYEQFPPPQNMADGNRFSYTFAETGLFDVNCHIHHGIMKGTLSVG